MKTWKDAWWLLKFEYKTFPVPFVRFILTLGIGLFLFVSTITSPDEQATFGTEWLIFFIIFGFPYTTRPEHFQPTNVGLEKRVSPFIALAQTIALSQKTIATYRVCSFITISTLYNCIFFTLFYALSPYMRSITSIETYIVFTIMLICLVIYIGGFLLRFEAGFHFVTAIIAIIFFGTFALFGSLILFYETYTKGLIQWLLDLSAAYPMTVTVGSIILAILGTLYHIHGLTRKLEKNDY